jgi:hypothetical protein
VNFDEIRSYFKLVGYDINPKNIEKALFCLIKLELIREVSRGNKTFFIPSEEDNRRYLTLPGDREDSARFAVKLSEYYAHPSQLARREAISEIGG